MYWLCREKHTEICEKRKCGKGKDERLITGEQDVPNMSSHFSYYCRILLLTLQCFDFSHLSPILVVLLLLTDGSTHELL
jgi:hypothetical protein